jgi:predicted phosphodiesterase
MMKKLFHVQFISDLHLDRNVFEFSPSAAVLAVLGNIGDPFKKKYSNFLKEASSRYEHVILIAGNHEYDSNPDKNLARIQSVAKRAGNNVHFLENSVKKIDDVCFAGTTLWPEKYFPFNRSKAFIKDVVKNESNIVMCTHMPPYSMRMNEYNFDPDISKAMSNPKIQHWLHGHSHRNTYNNRFLENGCPVSSNCYGSIDYSNPFSSRRTIVV